MGLTRPTTRNSMDPNGPKEEGEGWMEKPAKVDQVSNFQK